MPAQLNEDLERFAGVQTNFSFASHAQIVFMYQPVSSVHVTFSISWMLPDERVPARSH